MPAKSNVVPLPQPHDGGEYLAMLNSFLRACRAKNLSPKTLEHYDSANRDFLKFLVKNNLPLKVDAITREHVEKFMDYMLQNYAPSSAENRFKGLRVFFNWLAHPDEGEIAKNPMERMSAPFVPEKLTQPLKDEYVKKMLDSCKGNTLEPRRDAAIINVFYDTGMRREGMAGLRYTPDNPLTNDVYLDDGLLRFILKGRHEYIVPISAQSVKAIDRYLRVRVHSRYASDQHLWIGRVGPIQPRGIHSIMKKIARRAGLDVNVYPHLFRHTFSHNMKRAGLSDENIMELAGWRSNTMLRRYGKAAAKERAIEAYRKLPQRDW